MSVQKSILSFFKPSAMAGKRNPHFNCQNDSNKRFKSSSNSYTSNSSSVSSFKENDLDKQDENTASTGNSKEIYQKECDVLTGEPRTVTQPSTLPPEEAKAVEKKRLQAKLKLLSKTLPIIDGEMGLTWFAALEKEFSKPYFKKLNDFVVKQRSQKTIYPSEKDVWSWTKFCTVKDVKVVILGQDPYHNPNQAHGLSFSVPVGVKPPPSLLNVYKELGNNFDKFQAPDHGYLMGWAMQGVLLLNSVLTVEANKPASHRDQGWEELTTAVIKYFNENCTNIVFFLWGSHAQKKADMVNTKNHLVLKAAHPSPLSASKGFFGCQHFRQSHNYLLKKKKYPIHWSWLPTAERKEGEKGIEHPPVYGNYDDGDYLRSVNVLSQS